MDANGRLTLLLGAIVVIGIMNLAGLYMIFAKVSAKPMPVPITTEIVTPPTSGVISEEVSPTATESVQPTKKVITATVTPAE